MAYKRKRSSSSYGRSSKRRRTWSLANTAVGLATAAYRRYSSTRTRRKRGAIHESHTGPSCTTRTDYRKRRMPAAKRRKWVSFTKKVRAVEISGLPKSTYKAIVFRTMKSTNGNQAYEAISFMPGWGNNEQMGVADITNLNLMSTEALGFNLDDQPGTRVTHDFQMNGPRVSSYIFDLSISNMLPTNAIIDLYELRINRDIISNQGDETNYMKIIMDHHNTFTADLENPGNHLSWGTYGITPFDIREFGQAFSVSKVETITLPGNGHCKRSYREPGNKRLGMGRFNNLLCRKGDRMLFFVSYGPNGVNGSGGGVYSIPTDIRIMAQRTYHWCMDGLSASTVKVDTYQDPNTN